MRRREQKEREREKRRGRGQRKGQSEESSKGKMRQAWLSRLEKDIRILGSRDTSRKGRPGSDVTQEPGVVMSLLRRPAGVTSGSWEAMVE